MSHTDSPERIRALFDELIDLPAAERADRLSAACGDDTDLRRAVEALLGSADAGVSEARRVLEALRPTGGGPPGPEPPDPRGPPARLREALAGRYQLEHEIGRGGMATVYRAEDLRHHRKVAVKVLDPDLAASIGAHRFLREIETVAQLTHPHILPLHDSGESDGFLYYVMPFVEGESLRGRLVREKQLPVDEAVQITCEVADALEYAHARGVIHRDIKPENVLLESGHAVVADFGIARAVSAAGGPDLTSTGQVMGTPAYMSPEQATGDARVGPATDIYALACVLYEMLVGEPPYTGSTAQAVLGKVIAGEAVSARKSRATIPANVDAVIRRGLEKLPADRFTGAQDLAKALADPGFRHGDVAAGGVPGGAGPWNRLTVAFAGVALLLALTTAWGMLGGRGTPSLAPPVLFRMAMTDFELNAPPGSGRRLAISRDGSQIALASVVDGVSKIFLRDAGRLDFREVPGTEGANDPDFSPDGRWLVFEAGGRLSRVEVSGGPVLPMAQGTVPHWGLDDVVVFQGSGGLYRVAPSGGDPVLILDGGVGDSRPFLLPDGKAVVFQRGGTGLEERLMLVEIESGEVTDLGVTGSNPRYVPTGFLVFGQPSQALMAIPFDLETHRVTGPPSTVVPDVAVFSGGATQFAASETGTAVYMSGRAESYELVWVSRGGAVEPVDSAWTGDFQFPALSPDGTRLAVDIRTTGSRDVWVKQLDRGPSLKITFEGTDNSTATWTPGGESVTYRSNRAGGFDLWTRRADGSALAVLQLDRERNLAQALWSPDGEWLVYRTAATDPEGADILALRPGQDALPTALVATQFVEHNIALSPDGRWLAYRSNETGQGEIYVVPFPNAGDAKWAVSTSGGSEPVWSNSGRELFYRNGRGEMVAVPIVAGETFVLGQPEVLFSATGFRSAANLPMYDVAPNDQRFIMIRQREVATAGEVVVVVNWFEELKAWTKVRSP